MRRWAALLRVIFLLICLPFAAAGSSEPAAGTSEPAAGTSEPAADHAEEHDPHAQYKYSAAVRYLAQKTGMSVNAAYWTSVLLNFAIVAAAIGYLARKKMPGAFRSRTSVIQKSLEEARRASEDARRRLGEIEGRLARIDTEIVGLEANAELQGHEEEARLRGSMEEERQKIIRSTEQEIARVANNARRDLKLYAAELAVSLAEKKINVDPATDAEIVREFVEQLNSDGATRKKG